ncbi:MAG: GspH/FimT family pseudopilin [Mariprofundus sp.]|nr:GspH/FimT family pseudopilin [Mariprofundus sp.]
MHLRKPESGFTLLEIMMVIVILSVTTMMVAPSFFSASSASLDDEGHRLVQTLRLAQDEATLSGQTLRITLRNNSYSFQSISIDAEWTPLQSSPYQSHQLIDGIRIEQIKPQPPLDEKDDPEKEPALGHLILYPEGLNQISDITLTQASDNRTLHIQFRPGPGGIRIVNDADTSSP